jgi:ADP-heptose:LPS heptosyltransferase
MALLLQGDFANGLPKYEQRWALKLAGLQPGDFASPLWHGEDPAGRTILLYSEQGLGDTLQFARYAPDVAKRGAKVILYVHPPLKELLSSLPGVDRVISLNEPIPAHDLRCPLLSLPLAFKTNLNSIPATIPYLEAPPGKAESWQMRFASCAGPKIGIVCSGSAQHHNDHNRSIPLASFKPLAEAAGGPLYLIQKEVRPDDEVTLSGSPEFVSLASEINDFSDTAAIIANLDLISAVDTSIVHLVGAMGKPIWTLLAFPPDWRWMLDRTDSPWYPTMKLFRQSAAGNWSAVLAQVASELRSYRGNSLSV